MALTPSDGEQGLRGRQRAPSMHSGLAGLPSQSTNLCRLSLGPFERGPGEVLLQGVPLSPPPSPPQICATLQPYLPGESCFSSQAGGGGISLLHQSSQDGNPHPESLPFTFPVTKTLLLSEVLLQSYLSYESYPQPPAPTPSWTLPEPSLAIYSCH